MGQSFFHFKQFSILQQAKGLKVTTDACVLGAVCHHPSPAKCLDIGTGTGVLALMMAQKFHGTAIDAIEMESSIADQATANAGHSKFSDRISIIHGDVFKHPFHASYDLMVSNPPYFTAHLEGESHEKNLAMHNSSMPADLLAARAAQLLSPGGRFWIIYPPREMEAFKVSAERSGLHLLEEMHVYNIPGRHFRTICCFQPETGGQANITKILLHHSDGTRTDQFSQLMHDFYLENTEFYKRGNQVKK